MLGDVCGWCVGNKLHLFCDRIFSLSLIIALAIAIFVVSAWLLRHSSCRLLKMTLCPLGVDRVCLCGTRVNKVSGIFVISEILALRSSCL